MNNFFYKCDIIIMYIHYLLIIHVLIPYTIKDNLVILRQTYNDINTNIRVYTNKYNF